MENKTQLSPVPKKSQAKLVVVVVLMVLLAAGVGTGSYFWQHKKVNNLSSKVSHLQTELAVADGSATTARKQSATSDVFTYSPKTGGLSLTLPKIYGVVVSVDGNKGGAAGATFRVASVTDSNIFEDSSYQGVQVDIDNTFTNLAQAVSSEETQLDEQRGTGSTEDRNYKVSDTTVAGLPAKLLTADGLDEYQGDISVYLIGSGSFTYTITANGTQSGNPVALTVLLKGLHIKPITL